MKDIEDRMPETIRKQRTTYRLTTVTKVAKMDGNLLTTGWLMNLNYVERDEVTAKAQALVDAGVMVSFTLRFDPMFRANHMNTLTKVLTEGQK
jgi:hypothetical protein